MSFDDDKVRQDVTEFSFCLAVNLYDNNKTLSKAHEKFIINFSLDTQSSRNLKSDASVSFQERESLCFKKFEAKGWKTFSN